MAVWTTSMVHAPQGKAEWSEPYELVTPLSLLVLKATFYNEHYERCLLFSSWTEKNLRTRQKKLHGNISIRVANKRRKWHFHSWNQFVIKKIIIFKKITPTMVQICRLENIEHENMKQVSYSGKYSLSASRAHQFHLQFYFVVGMLSLW